MNRSMRFDPEPFEFFAAFEGELPGYDKEFAYLEWEGEFGHRGRSQPAPSRDHIPPSASRSVYPKMPFPPQRMDRLFARPTYVHNAHIVGVQPAMLSFGSELAEEEVEIPVSVTVPLSWSKTDLNGYSSMPPTAGFYAIVHGKSAYVGRELHVRDRFYQRYRMITTELDINPDCFRNVQVYFARHTVSRPRTNQEVNNFYAVEIALIQNWQGTLRNKDLKPVWLAQEAAFQVINNDSLAPDMPQTARLKHTSRRPRT